MRRHPFVLALVVAGLLAVLVGAQGAGAQEPAKTPTAIGTGGAAASVDALGTDAAVDVLRRGGNAVDAAIAAAGVLGVVEPFSCGIGGGGFMVVRTPSGKVTTIDGRETAPAAMEPDSFFEAGKPLAFDPARFSGLSAGVPGTPATWERALRKYGTTTLAEALAPGMKVAREGFTVDPTFFNQVDAVKTYFDDVPSTEKIYLDADGTPKDVGTRITNPDMAKTYAIIGRDGAEKGFYRGEVGAATAEAAANPPIAADADHTWRKGLMTERDLKAYRAIDRKPVVSSYRGLDVYGMGPPSSGGTAVAEVLNILAGYQPAGASKTEVYHRLLEASRYAFADRNAYLADPAFFDVPLAGLTSMSFAAERRAEIGPRPATSPVAPGDPYDNQKGGGRNEGKASATISHPRQSTTHLTVVDKDGMMVSYTFTIESTGGNAVVVPGYGFLLNNELTDFNFDSTTHPNRADGGKRPRSSMSPTVIEKDGAPYMAVGSPGGSTIIGTVLEILVNRLDLGQTLPQAIAAPRAVERNTATAQAEQAFIDSLEGQELKALGHVFAPPAPPGEIGAATGIELTDGGGMIAAAEPVRRGSGAAGVVTPR